MGDANPTPAPAAQVSNTNLVLAGPVDVAFLRFHSLDFVTAPTVSLPSPSQSPTIHFIPALPYVNGVMPGRCQTLPRTYPTEPVPFPSKSPAT